MKSGDARVALIGFPSVGKVSLSVIGKAVHLNFHGALKFAVFYNFCEVDKVSN